MWTIYQIWVVQASSQQMRANQHYSVWRMRVDAERWMSTTWTEKWLRLSLCECVCAHCDHSISRIGPNRFTAWNRPIFHRPKMRKKRRPNVSASSVWFAPIQTFITLYLFQFQNWHRTNKCERKVKSIQMDARFARHRPLRKNWAALSIHFFSFSFVFVFIQQNVKELFAELRTPTPVYNPKYF